MIEPDFNARILKGDDIISLEQKDNGNGSGNEIILKGKEEGTALLEVDYDAIDIKGDNSVTGQYGACYDNRKGLAVIQVGGNHAKVNFGIKDAFGKKKKWDSEFDTVYFFDEGGSVKMEPEAEGSSVAKVEVNNNPAGDSWKTVVPTEGQYEVPVVNGNNIIKVTTVDGKSAYQVVRGAKANFTVENLTSPGQEPVAGDKVRVKQIGRAHV